MLASTVTSEIFAKVLFSENFVKIKPSGYVEITLSFSNLGKLWHSRDFLTSKICLLTIFAKIRFSRKFPELQYPICVGPYTILFRRMRFYLSVRFLSLYI